MYFKMFLQTPRKKKTRHGNNPPVESHVGWVMDSKEHRPRQRTYSQTSQGYLNKLVVLAEGPIMSSLSVLLFAFRVNVIDFYIFI